jgi:hypothetical protein
MDEFARHRFKSCANLPMGEIVSRDSGVEGVGAHQVGHQREHDHPLPRGQRLMPGSEAKR